MIHCKKGFLFLQSIKIDRPPTHSQCCWWQSGELVTVRTKALFSCTTVTARHLQNGQSLRTRTPYLVGIHGERPGRLEQELTKLQMIEFLSFFWIHFWQFMIFSYRIGHWRLERKVRVRERLDSNPCRCGKWLSPTWYKPSACKPAGRPVVECLMGRPNHSLVRSCITDDTVIAWAKQRQTTTSRTWAAQQKNNLNWKWVKIPISI